MGIGSITFSLPHFLSGPHMVHGSDGNSTSANICRAPRLLDQTDRDNILQNIPGLDQIKSLTEGKKDIFFKFKFLIFFRWISIWDKMLLFFHVYHGIL